MHAHILQHTSETPPGTVLDWFQKRKIPFTVTRFFAGDLLPDPTEVGWLVICGGGMGVHDETRYPWLRDEKRFIFSVIERGSTVLGLCLGAQLIAEVSGAKVARHSHWEVGWHPVRFDDGAELTAFQFHQDTFAIPAGAKRFGSSEACENQGFWRGERVLGLQFHPEAAEDWIRQCARQKEFPSGPFVQTPDQLIAGMNNLPPQTAWFERLLLRLEDVTRG